MKIKFSSFCSFSLVFIILLFFSFDQVKKTTKFLKKNIQNEWIFFNFVVLNHIFCPLKKNKTGVKIWQIDFCFFAWVFTMKNFQNLFENICWLKPRFSFMELQLGDEPVKKFMSKFITQSRNELICKTYSLSKTCLSNRNPKWMITKYEKQKN